MSTNFFQRVAISSASFAASPNVNLTGNSSFSLVNEGSGIVEYSFDGTNLHGDLVPNTPSSALGFNNRGFNLIWFRLKSGATSNIRVEAAPGTILIDNSGVTTGSGSTSSSISTVQALSTTFASGQLAVTASALALGSSTAFKNGFALTNTSASSASLFVGGSGVTVSNGFELAPGASLIIPVADISTIYVIAAAISTATASFIGFN